MVRRNIDSPANVTHSLAPSCLSFFTQHPVEKDRCAVGMRGFIDQHGTSEARSKIGAVVFELLQNAELKPALYKLSHDAVARSKKEGVLTLSYPLNLATLVAVHDRRLGMDLPIILRCLLRPQHPPYPAEGDIP